MQYQIRPLGPWTEKETNPRRSAGMFKATWSATLKLLGRELDWLDATNVVMQIDVHEGDIRLDGMLRANAKVGHPGVRIAFESIHGPLTYATDTYESRYYSDLASWQANVRAIALGLEALRAVDRYGVTKRGEQYRGWSQLPPGATPMGGTMSREEAVRLIAEHAGVGFLASSDLTDPARVRRLWRNARAAVHPDRTGDSAIFLRLEQAGIVLGVAK